MINNLILALINFLQEINARFELNLYELLEKYSFDTPEAVFAKDHMIIFFKTAFYSLIFIIPLAILKIVRAEDKFITYLFGIILIALVFSVFSIFLGFFQLLFI